MQHPIVRTIIPRKNIPNPTPTNTGNPTIREDAAVIPPTTKSIIPPIIHIIKMRP